MTLGTAGVIVVYDQQFIGYCSTNSTRTTLLIKLGLVPTLGELVTPGFVCGCLACSALVADTESDYAEVLGLFDEEAKTTGLTTDVFQRRPRTLLRASRP